MSRQRPLAGQRSRDRLAAASAPSVPSVPVPPPPSTPARRRPGGLLPLVAVAVVVALAVTAALLVVRVRAEGRAEAARGDAVAAAEEAAVALLSYDHRHLGRDFRAARDVLTGSFAADYAQTTRKVVRPTAREVKAVVTADVVASSVVRAEGDRVVVLLFVDQTTTSTRLDGPKVDLDRVRMTMSRADGRWLVGGLDAL